MNKEANSLATIEPVTGHATSDTPEKRRLSFTQLNMFLRCPRQYHYRYVLRIRTPASGAMVQSRVWHETVERNYRQKIASHADLPLEDVQAFYAERFDEALRLEEVVFEAEEKAGALKDEGLAIVAAHHREIAPTVQPLLVEKSFRVSLGANFPYELVGVWDLIEEGGIVCDNKAYSKTPNQQDLDRDLQMTIYSLAYRATFGEIEQGLRVDAVIKLKTPKAVQLPTRRTNRDCQWLLGLIEEVAQAMDQQVFFPNPNGWHCAPRFCGFWDRCMNSTNHQEVMTP